MGDKGKMFYCLGIFLFISGFGGEYFVSGYTTKYSRTTSPWWLTTTWRTTATGRYYSHGPPDYNVRMDGLFLEVYYHGQWGRVCSSGFDYTDAHAACHTLGFSGSTYHTGRYNDRNRPVWLNDVGCSGGDYTLYDCSVRQGNYMYACSDVVELYCVGLTTENTNSGYNDGYTASASGVQEAYTIRLVNGEGPWVGRLEVYHDNRWGTVCDDRFSTKEAAAVCDQLGYFNMNRDPVAYGNARYGSGSGPIWLDDVQCPDTYYYYHNFTECSSLPWGSNNCGHGEDVSVNCYPAEDVTTVNPTNVTIGYDSIRLVGSGYSSKGRLEVHHNGRWGTVCRYGFGVQEARAVCRQLGYSYTDYPYVYDWAYYGSGSGTIWLEGVRCHGYYDRFRDCQAEYWGHTSHCSHYQDVSIDCTGEQTTESQDIENTTQPTYTIAYNVNGPQSIRLVDGGRYGSGRVEVYYNGQWGSVCGDGFDREDALVICRSKGFSQVQDYDRYGYRYGHSNGPLWLSNIGCRGWESQLYDCRMDVGGITYCTHSYSVSVDCGDTTALPNYQETTLSYDIQGAYDIRLVNGEGPWVGRLEVYHNYGWGTVCDDNFSTNEAVAVCNQLGFPNKYRMPVAYSGARYGQGSGPIWLDQVDCPNKYYHYNLTQCKANPWGINDCSHSEDVSVNCFTEDVSTVNPTYESVTIGYNSIRLVGSGYSNRGRLEVYYNGRWGTVCRYGFGVQEARAVCRQLGYLYTDYPYVYNWAYYGSGNGTIWLEGVRCHGYYDRFRDCQAEYWGRTSHCSHYQDVSIDCTHEQTTVPPNYQETTLSYDIQGAYDIRLVNGEGPWVGRLEVYHNYRWGTVCDDNFSTNEAVAVCNQLGFPNKYRMPVAYSSARYGQGSGPIWLDQVDCPNKYYHYNLTQCKANPWGINDCSHSEDVSVNCFREDVTTVNPTYESVTIGYDSIRLVGSGYSNRGRLEVYYNGRWGTVCRYGFGVQEARAVCRQLGYLYTDYPYVYNWAYYGRGNGTIWLEGVRCHGYYDRFRDCQAEYWGHTSHCSHYQDVSIDCTQEQTTVPPNYQETTLSYDIQGAYDIRLVNGEGPWVGRLEVYHNYRWGTVCDDNFSTNEAVAVCNQLGFPNKYRMPVAYSGARYGQGSGPIWLDEVDCPNKYYHYNLTQCKANPWGINDCSHSEDVSVNCFREDVSTVNPTYESVTIGYDSIRLVGSINSYKGRLEVYQNGRWGTVCRYGFGIQEARAVCHQLGYYYTDYPTVYDFAYYGEGYGPIWLEDVQCDGYYDLFRDCKGEYVGYMSNCSHSDDVSINCRGDYYASVTPYSTTNYVTTEQKTPVRLVGGYGYYEGRLEVYHNGEWGTVCSDDFNADAAHVVCKMLDIDYHRYPVVHYGSSYYGSGSGRIWLDDLKCSGYETDISHCITHYWGYSNCNHYSDVGINCQRESYEVTTVPYLSIQLSNGYYGRLEIHYEGSWGTVCDDAFNADAAYVVCRSLGYNRFRYPRYYTEGGGHGTIWLDNVRCQGYENDIGECRTQPWGSNDCTHAEDVGINCYEEDNSYTTQMPWFTTRRFSDSSYENAIQIGCMPSNWDIRVHLPLLYQKHADFVPSDISLGQQTCHGYQSGDYLIFSQDYSSCSTKKSSRYGNVVYTSTLTYAKHDPNYQFIIREYRFQIDVECDMTSHEVVSQDILQGHMQQRSNHPHMSATGHYDLEMSFYSDRYYNYRMYGNPITANIGQEIYVKVFTTLGDWDIKMSVDDCYTLPSPHSSSMKYFLIRSGCPTDPNTHVTYTDNHETRFSFKDFEYTANQDHLYVYCMASFCNITDPYAACDSYCHHSKRKAIDPERKNHILNTTEVMETIRVTPHVIRRRDTRASGAEHTGAKQSYYPLSLMAVTCVVSVAVFAVVLGFILYRRNQPKTTMKNIQI